MDEETKARHSKRIQQKENHIKQQVRIAKQHGISSYSDFLDQPHRFVKHSAMNCGNPKCIYCANPRRLFNEKTKQEKSFEQTKVWTET